MQQSQIISYETRLEQKVARLEEKLAEYTKMADIHEENRSVLLAEIRTLGSETMTSQTTTLVTSV